MEIAFRDYQAQSVYLLDRAINAGKHPLCIAPTGSGKSIVIAGLIKKRNQPVLVLSHVAELLKQNAKILRRLDPHISMSFFSAGLGEKNASAQVVFGSVQSVYRNLRRFRKARPLLLIDEAHLCPRSSDAMYAQVFAHFFEARRVGFTATPMRVDSGSLIDGSDAWFNHVAHEVGVVELIEKGWLLPLSGVIAEAQADLEGVGSRGGDFIMEQAQEAVMRTLSLDAAVEQACMLAQRRKAWLLFAVGVEHAKQIQKVLGQHGIESAMILGDTPDSHRDEHFKQFRAGKLQCLVNVGVLTTGFDAPNLDCIISMRPTRSPVLWQQMLGRGMRLSQGKKDCLLLDFVGNLDRLGGAGAVIEVSDRRLPEDLRAKEERAALKRRKTRKQPEFYDASGRDPMLSGDTFAAEVKEMNFFLATSRKQPGKRMVVANYKLEDQFGRSFTANTFLCVEYAGAAFFMTCRWFGLRGMTPTSVPRQAQTALALAQSFDAPAEVSVRHDERMRCYVIESERFAALDDAA